MHQLRSFHVTQSGLGLIEVLITILILSIGIAGIISTQLTAKRLSYEAMQRSIATYLAHDIAERMRNNPNALGNYVVAQLGGESIESRPSPNCLEAICTPTQLAVYDLWEWEQSLDGASERLVQGDELLSTGGLLSPRACIQNNAGEISIAVAWEGFQETLNPDGSTCGEGLGLYGTNDAKRQLLFITTFIGTI